MVSRRTTVPSNYLSLATAMAICVWASHVSKMNLAYHRPSLTVTASFQSECLGKPATSPPEHLGQAGIHREWQKAASEDLDETCPDLAKQDVAWTVLPPGFGKIKGNGNKIQDMQNGTS